MATSTAQTPVPHPCTWDQFIALDEDDPRELIDGELLEVEEPTRSHERAVARLIFLLTQWADQGGRGEVMASGYKVRISKVRGVMPDVQFYRTGNPAILEEQGLASGHPDLAVEVISQSSQRLDRLTKLHWYAEIGVPEYWLVDPQARTLERLVLREGQYALEQKASNNDSFRPESFPGLEVALAQLWPPS